MFLWTFSGSLSCEPSSQISGECPSGRMWLIEQENLWWIHSESARRGHVDDCKQELCFPAAELSSRPASCMLVCRRRGMFLRLSCCRDLNHLLLRRSYVNCTLVWTEVKVCKNSYSIIGEHGAGKVVAVCRPHTVCELCLVPTTHWNNICRRVKGKMCRLQERDKPRYKGWTLIQITSAWSSCTTAHNLTAKF